MAILVTGGAGFIGSHVCAELLAGGHEVVVADDYSNSDPAALDAVRSVTGRPLTAHELDVRDCRGLGEVLSRQGVTAVVHCAAKKAVGESVRMPLQYYDVNVAGTISLLRAMAEHGVHHLVFSSSCSVYGDRYRRPITEDDPPSPVNPYAWSKLMCEQVMADACARYPELSVTCLRYFNPVGAHPSGALGEAPRGVPGNLFPYLMQAAAGQAGKLEVLGADYDTPDGTGVRDYLHVMDVAQAHRTALARLGDGRDGPGHRVLNLGTGRGVSVLGVIAAFEEACGVPVPYVIAGRRPGDVSMLVADPSRVRAEWGWRATRGLAEMLRDAWQFHQRCPPVAAAR